MFEVIPSPTESGEEVMEDISPPKQYVMDIRPEDRFKLTKAFLEQYRFKRPNWGPVGEITYRRTYSRRKPDGMMEDWWETLKRVVEGVYTYQKWHCHKLNLPWSDNKGQRSAQMMYQLMFEMKFLPPGRGLWMCGTEYIEKYGGAALNNCAFTSTVNINTNFSEPFIFLMDMSMLGVGVGGNCAGAGKVIIQAPEQGSDIHVVEDSREGWLAVTKRVLDAYVGKATLPDSIDYSLVRKKGAPIKGFGGVAAGPEPLMQLVKSIHDILNPLINQPITSPAITALFNVIGVCVVSGNVRRSAEIMLGDHDDGDFARIKNHKELKSLEHVQKFWKQAFRMEYLTHQKLDYGNVELRLEWPEGWTDFDLKLMSTYDIESNYSDAIKENKVLAQIVEQLKEADSRVYSHPLMTHLWASNNSLNAVVGMDYTEPSKSTAENGEPGYVWMDNARKYGRMVDPPDWADEDAEGTNPCSEQTLCHKELCCLVETFPSRHENYDEFQKTLKWAYLYAKTITLIPTHNPGTNAVVMRNRRIGASLAGITEAFTCFGRTAFLDWCDTGYKYLRKLDRIYSDWLCIPKSRKITSVKPGGTVPLLPGVTPGIHYDHSAYYWRLIRIAYNNPLIPAIQAAGYYTEPDKYDKSGSTAVVYFPVKSNNFQRGKNDVTMWEQLANAAAIQRYWADNQVSITVTFTKKEAADIARALEIFEDQLKSVSFLPAEEAGVETYVQAPYQEITKEVYEAAMAKIKPIDYSLVRHDVEDKYCDGDKCLIPAPAPSAS